MNAESPFRRRRGFALIELIVVLVSSSNGPITLLQALSTLLGGEVVNAAQY